MNRILTLLLTALSLALTPAGVLGQTTISVTTLDDEDNDDGDCSLREALVAAVSDDVRDACPAGTGTDTIDFSVAGTIPVTFLVTINEDTIIEGPGSDVLTLEAQGENRIFSVDGATATISGLTLTGGNATSNSGGAIVVFNTGTLHLSDCLVEDNRSTFDGGGLYLETSTATISACLFRGNEAAGGGAIMNLGGSLTLTNSTLVDNNALQDGGGVWTTNTGSELVIMNSTVSHNTAHRSGAGLFVANGMATLTNLTLTDNTADADADGAGNGGGVLVGENATVSFRNVLVAGNLVESTAGTVSPDVETFGTLVSEGFNLIGDGTGAPAFVDGVNGDQVGDAAQPLDPRLGPLGLYDAGLPTHTLLYNSPALDTGACTDASGMPIATDQRGFDRPQGSGCDIGAFERRSEDALTPVEETELPEAFYMSAVYPNPFNPQAHVRLEVVQSQPVRLVVYDLVGRAMLVLYDGPLAAGHMHQFRLDASTFASGLYLLRAEGATFSAVRPVVVAK